MNRYVLAAAALWLAPTSALAAPGDHLRVGDAEVTPQVALGTEYRTNFFRSEADPSAAANIGLSPSVAAALSGDDHDFNSGFRWQLRKYVYREDGGNVNELDRGDDMSWSLGTNLFKRSAVGLVARNNFAIANVASDSDFADVPYNSRLRNSTNMGIRFNPGPALSVTPGGVFRYDAYRTPRIEATDSRLYNQRNTYGPTMAVRWSFLPRTSAVVNGSYLWNNWTDPGDAVVSDSTFWRVNAGVEGQVTAKTFAEIFLGYGGANYDSPTATQLAAADGLLVKLQGRYKVTETSNLSAGYARNFRDSFFTDVAKYNYLYAQIDGRIGKLEPRLQYGIRFEEYDGEIQRADIVNKVSSDVGYWFREWGSASAGVNWIQRASNVSTVEFDDFNIHGSVTFRY